MAVCWSPIQSDLIFSGDESGKIGVWEHVEDRQAFLHPEKSTVFCLAASPVDRSHLAVGYKNGVILLIDVKKAGMILNKMRGHDEEVHSLAWCPIPGEDFKSQQETVPDIADLETFGVDFNLTEVKKVQEGFGTDGHLLASGSQDRTVRIWSTVSGRQLLQLKLPNSSWGRSSRGDNQGRNKVWLTLCWPRGRPKQLISSSFNGEMLVWDITKTGKEKCKFMSAPSTSLSHTRIIFNICSLGPTHDRLLSVSMDRKIVLWDLTTCSAVYSLPTLGGYVYAVNTSPLDPGRLALGVGDAVIRVMNLNSSEGNDVTVFWQGIKSKVTALCWHPVKEGLLAYGTDDGRVGIYDVLSTKPPNISTTYHRRTVYVVAWGPPCPAKEPESKSTYFLYSVGDGVILEHDPFHLTEEAVKVNDIIEETNGSKGTKFPIRSAASWSPDFKVIAVGNDDGSVEVYQSSDMKLLAVVHIHHKLINVIVWHPYFTMETASGSQYQHWIATGSNEAVVHVVDLTKAFAEREPGREPLYIRESMRQLEGHSGRITGLAWSPHKEGQLASVSYDGRALVWDVASVQIKACYQGHLGKLLCVEWSGLDPDDVITGGDGFALHRWKVSKHTPHPDQLEPKKKKKYKAKPIKAKTESSDVMNNGPTVDEMPVATVTLATEDQIELEDLLEKKKRELMRKSNNDGVPVIEPHVQKVEKEVNGHVDVKIADFADTCVMSESKAVGDDQESNQTVHGDEDTSEDFPLNEIDKNMKTISSLDGKSDLMKESGYMKEKKRRKPKSVFPVSSKKDNRGKTSLLEDIVLLAKIIYGTTENKQEGIALKLPQHTGGEEGEEKKYFEWEEIAHLGFYLNRQAIYKCLHLEGEYHRNNDNMEYYYQLEIWKGNINGALRVARQREELSDWLVAMAPMASFDTWTSVCEDYALQLESDGQYHKAATYFLACHKVYDAIEVFKRHKLFKEAIALAKVRLSPLDPALEELYTLWAKQLTKDGNYEQAAKCHLAMKQVQDAAKLLARRYDQSSLKTAAQISLIANEKQHGLMYAQKVVSQHLLKHEWKEAYSYLTDQKGLQVFVVISSIHEILVKEINRMVPDLFAVEDIKFTSWSEKSAMKPVLPDFILDPEENDPMSPWEPHLVDGHSFPHYILWLWYTHLDVAMDTTSVEDMYKTLSLLHAGHQAQVDVPQIINNVCADLALCMLSLLMSETPAAISHLLQAMSCLHEAGQHKLMQTILQIFLPQGPKYILKLQQEVTAVRVMISLDSHSTMDRASKVHTIKRYLSDLKDDTIVTCSSLRCRELDCLRAYYFLAVLTFLRENLSPREITDYSLTEADQGQANPQSDQTEAVRTSNSVRKQSKDKTEPLEDQSGGNNEDADGNSVLCIKSEIVKTDIIGTHSEAAESSATESQESLVDTAQENGESQPVVISNDETVSQGIEETKTTSTISITDNTNKDVLKFSASTMDKESQCPTLPNHNDLFQSATNPKHGLFSHSHPPTSRNYSEGSVTNYYSLNILKLCQLAQGLLWDIQAKRFALTETLGYIHKAISQLLLTKKPNNGVLVERSELSRADNSDRTDYNTESAYTRENGSNQKSVQNLDSAGDNQRETSSASSNKDDASISTSSSECIQNRLPSVIPQHEPHLPHVHRCKHMHEHGDHIISHHFSHIEHSENISVFSDGTDENLEFVGLFDICASCELLHKSRKVLWEDEPQCYGRPDHGSRKVVSIINPAKYINVPDEWYDMPVDQKYFKPYITMAVLKDEQEYVMHELKRGPDGTQTSFPNPLESVKILMDVCTHCPKITQLERRDFAQKAITWTLNFATTTQHKQTFIDLLQTHMGN
ncbi:hypothetical protein CHS0354_035471 [Potamilus streckersoni]|uniref:Gem-associated protein 5 n=1 Tax=Potamilus streckersoni TaxID=2493646 RepID=A0AAE0RVU1_9BIVA|nr:hypothetical protein CHS0354_035471 [Potamilus streckersoni]